MYSDQSAPSQLFGRGNPDLSLRHAARSFKRPSVGFALMVFLVITPLLWLAVAQLKPEWDPAVMALTFHFWAVSGASLMAGGLAIVVIASARSLRHTQALFVALGFLALAVIFSAHGLTTWPGKYERAHSTGVSDQPADAAAFSVDDYGEIYSTGPIQSSAGATSSSPDASGTVVSAWLSLAAGAFFVGIGSLRFSLRQRALVSRYGRRLFLLVLALVVAYTAATVFVEGLWAWIPWQNAPFRLVTTAASLGLLIGGAYRYGKVWWLVGLSVHGSMAIALVLLAESQFIMATREAWHLSWWLYHFMLLVAFTLLFVSWAVEARRARSLGVIAEGLALQGALSDLKPSFVDSVAQLLDALEVKDEVTQRARIPSPAVLRSNSS